MENLEIIVQILYVINLSHQLIEQTGIIICNVIRRRKD